MLNATTRRIAFLTCLALATAWVAAEPTTEPVPAGDKPQPYIRTTKPKESTHAMEIAAREFVPSSGKGPSVWLVGAVHIGEASYYDALQEFLNAQPLVLYEGIGRPPFMEIKRPADDAARAQRTRAAIQFTAALVDWYRGKFGSSPRSLAMLKNALKETGRAEVKYLRHSEVDGWDRALDYKRNDKSYTVTSLGADGKSGGEGVNADIVHTGALTVAAPQEGGPGGIQLQLAKALALEFQLNGIDYDQKNFLNSDMSMRQLEQRVAESGAGAQQFEQLRGMLEGSGFAASALKFVLKIVQSNPKYQGFARLLMIELLGKIGGEVGSIGDAGMQKLMSVILNDRNTVVLEDLKAVLAEKDAPKSISIFYGAAHLAEMEERLVKEMGYKPTKQFWLSAISVDAKAAGITEAELQMVQGLIEAQLKQIKAQSAKSAQPAK